MDGPALLKPALYEEAEDGTVWLKGGVCSCGHVFFPLQAFGCEACGGHGEALSPRRLEAVGQVISSATVHLHAGRGREAPFNVCVVKLNGGPVIRSLTMEGTALAQPGQTVRAVLAVADGKDPGAKVRDLRFAVTA